MDKGQRAEVRDLARAAAQKEFARGLLLIYLFACLALGAYLVGKGRGRGEADNYARGLRDGRAINDGPLKSTTGDKPRPGEKLS